jgi:cell division protein ZapA
MESVAEKQSVRVTILSRPYVLRTADDPRQVEALAGSVNELMLSIAGRAPNADSTHIAVLACLHLADKLRLLEHEFASVKERVDRKSGDLAALLDQAMLDQAMLGETMLDQTMLDQTVLDQTVLDQTMLDQTMLDQTMVDQLMPEQPIEIPGEEA